MDQMKFPERVDVTDNLRRAEARLLNELTNSNRFLHKHTV